MREARVLDATDIRGRLLDALQPLVDGLLSKMPPERHDLVLAKLRVYVRPFPIPGEERPGARIMLVIVEPDGSSSSGEVLTGGLAVHCLNREAIEQATADALAFALSDLGEDAAAEVMAATEARRAVLMVMAKPATGTVHVVSVPKKGRPLVLGALIDEAQTLH